MDETNETVAATETRAEALARIVREMLDEGGEALSKGKPKLRELNNRMADAMVEADVPEGEEWEDVKAAELTQALRAFEEQSEETEPEDPGSPELPTIYPSALYAPGKPSRVAQTLADAKVLRRSGYKCFDAYSVEE
ncbi:MAG TPA: hypothetical protein VJ957_06575, partial [Longimicrobiales bacterium]|nr:hypothetical protein [Longimicrobiales bacterium]